MSKDDFRDRLKSYSMEPDRSDWVKMQQLLDADEDDRKGVAWWKFGALLALLLIPTSIYLMGGFSISEKSEDQHIASLSNTSNTNIANIEASKLEVSTTTQAQSDIEKSIEKTPVAETLSTKKNNSNSSKKSGTQISEHRINKTNTNKISNTVTTNRAISNSQNPIAYNSSQLKTSKLPSSILSFPTETQGDIVAEVLKEGRETKSTTEENTIISKVGIIENFEPSTLNIDERELPLMTYAPYKKVYPKVKNNPWYLVTAVGMKYPLVEIGEAQVGSFIPTQKFFPSYVAEAGVGKHFGKISVEGGATASLYQYKLGKVFGEENRGEAAAMDLLELEDFDPNTNGSTFIINKFALFSPYLRGQYTFDLKKNWALGIHALVSINSKINLANQVVSEEFPTSYDNTIFINNSSEQTALFTGTGDAGLNIGYDLGFSLEKMFAKKGRIAVDFSYSFGRKTIEEGTYSVLRETSAETNGLYSINGTGPQVKFRYYLNSNG